MGRRFVFWAGLVWAVFTAGSGLAQVPAGSSTPGKSPEALIRQATALQKDRNHAEAAKVWETVLAEFPQDPRLPTVRHNLAICLLESGQPEKAVPHCRELLENHPSYPHLTDVRRLLGLALAEAGRAAAPRDWVAANRYFAQARAALEDGLKQSRGEHAAEFRYHLGVVLVALGEAGAAGKAFDEFLGEFPTHDLAAEVRFRRAELWLAAGKAAQAEPLLRAAAAATHFAFADVSAIRLAECLYEMGQKDEAIQQLTSFPQRFTNSRLQAAALARAVTWLAEAGKAAEAGKLVKEMLDSGSPEAEAAAVEFVRLTASVDGKTAEKVATAALARFPSGQQTAQLRLYRGIARFVAGDAGQALQDLEAARRGKLTADQDAYAARSTGTCLARLGKHTEAIAAFDQVRERHPSYHPDGVLFERAASVEHVQPGKEAAEAYERIARDHPDSTLAPEALVRGGVQHMQARAHQEAERCFSAALSRPIPGGLRDFARLRLGYSQLELGKHAEAAATLDLLVKEAPAGELSQAGLYFAALAYERSGNPASALERYTRAAATQAYAEQARLGAGKAALKLGKLEEADQHFQSLLKEFPRSVLAQEARLGQAGLLRARGQGEEARAAYEAITKERLNTPAEAQATFYQGELLASRGKPREAATAYRLVEGYELVGLAAEALFRAGEIYLSLGDAAQARACFLRLADPRYAGHPRAAAAADRLRRLK